MESDSKKIEKLYESIIKSDYFHVNEKDFDWNEFIKIDEGFLDLNSIDLYDYLLESFEKIKSEKDSDTYEVKLHNGLVFYTSINYYGGKLARQSFDKKRMEAIIMRDLNLAKEYEEKLCNIKENEEICVVMFKDEMGRIDRTGEVNLSAKELFITLKNALLDSWSNRNFSKSKVIIVRSAKNDEKRLNFYKFLFTKYILNLDFVVDKTTESEYNILYAINNTL